MAETSGTVSEVYQCMYVTVENRRNRFAMAHAERWVAAGPSYVVTERKAEYWLTISATPSLGKVDVGNVGVWYRFGHRLVSLMIANSANIIASIQLVLSLTVTTIVNTSRPAS